MKIREKSESIKPMNYVEATLYDYYVAIDWSSTVMSIARMRNNSIKPKVERNLPAKLSVIKNYVKQLSGKVILTIEDNQYFRRNK